jgi:hypothetical protein
MRFEVSVSLRLIQSLVSGEPAAHLGECRIEQPRDLGLGQAERLSHLRLRPLEEEPLEDDPALARIQGTRCARDERTVEAQLLERR